MPQPYEHLFFDLDRTLWDFESSAAKTFSDLFEKHKLKSRGIENVAIFHDVYTRHNEMLWDLYRAGDITKEHLRGERFFLTLKDFGIDDPRLATAIGEDYVTLAPLNVRLFPNAFEILEYLLPNYQLHLITNGFSETQFTKLRVSGLDRFFKQVITSEEAGVKKPFAGIFEFALKKTGASVNNSLMIGDDYEVDIIGARQFGMDQVHFDPHDNYRENGSTYTIKNLIELKKFL